MKNKNTESRCNQNGGNLDLFRRGEPTKITLLLFVLLALTGCCTCPAPKQYEGVQDTCDMQMENCLKYCDENATQAYMPIGQCKHECRLDWDECMALP